MMVDEAGGGWGGKGRCVRGVGVEGGEGGLNDATNTRARWDRTPKQLRVTVIMQAKLPSMVYVHVCVCRMRVDMSLCMCIVLHTL